MLVFNSFILAYHFCFCVIKNDIVVKKNIERNKMLKDENGVMVLMLYKRNV